MLFMSKRSLVSHGQSLLLAALIAGSTRSASRISAVVFESHLIEMWLHIASAGFVIMTIPAPQLANFYDAEFVHDWLLGLGKA